MAKPIEVQGRFHEPYIKGFCVGCHRFEQFLSELSQNRWRCDACRTIEETSKERPA